MLKAILPEFLHRLIRIFFQESLKMLDKEQCDSLCPKSNVNGGKHYTVFPLSLLLAPRDAVDLTCRSGWQLGMVHKCLQVEKESAWPWLVMD